MKLLYALRFLTIIPIPYREDENLEAVAASALYYPLVGTLIGALLFAISKGASLLWSQETASVLVLLIWTLVTGGLHLDGLSDLADGIGGGKTKEEKLAIMKDSRVGAFGAITLMLFLLTKWRMAAESMEAGLATVLLAAPTAGRWATLLAIRLFPAARREGMGQFFKRYGKFREVVIGGVFAILVALLVSGPAGLIAVMLAVALTMLAAAWVSSQLGGLTGDVYGAVIEFCELCVLILIVPISKFF